MIHYNNLFLFAGVPAVRSDNSNLFGQSTVVNRPTTFGSPAGQTAMLSSGHGFGIVTRQRNGLSGSIKANTNSIRSGMN